MFENISDSDAEIIPMRRINKNKQRFLESESEDDLKCTNSDSGNARKRKRIIEIYSSTESEGNVSDDFTRKISGNNNDNTYAQKFRKVQRNSGKKYYTQNGKIKPAKMFQNKDCRCRKNCIKYFHTEERKSIFERFWNLGDFNKQNILLYEAVEQITIKRKRLINGKGTPRNYSFHYFLKTDRGKFRVCKKFFLETFNISEGRLKRNLNSETPGNDMRGRMNGSSRKITEEEKKSVHNHIHSFPEFESHYTRSHNPNRKFLHPDLNIKKMFALYLLKCKESNTSSVNEWTYRKIFKKNFNLHFHQPRKDTCEKCDRLNNKVKASNNNEEKKNLMEEHDAHLRQAELARQSLKNDQDLILNNPNRYFGFSFDLQKALPYPKLSTSVAYYKRSLYISNLGFHNFHDNNVYMYVWNETIASKGSQEVSSCILKHLKNLKNEKHIIAYSDMCSGQNRNIKVALTWLKFIQSAEHNVDVIDHKFLLSGHSFLPNDRDFGVVEMALRKNNSLFVPEEYYEVIKKCGKNKFTLNEMKREDFISTKPLENAIYRRLKNINGEKVNWLKITSMRFLRTEPYKLFYKTSMDDDAPFKTLDLLPRRGRPKKFSNIKLTPLYEKTRPIATLKYNDLMDLLHYIPPIHHNYFKSIPHTQIDKKMTN